jgi:hypothetical protein
MRTPFILFFIVCFSIGFSQRERLPTFYLNTNEIDINKVYINPKNLDSINIDKQSLNGEIYLYINYEKVSFLTLCDILKKHIEFSGLNDSVLVRIDEKNITDISGIKIDKSISLKIDIEDLSDVKYIADKFHSIKIVSIALWGEKRKSKPRLYSKKTFMTLDDILKKYTKISVLNDSLLIRINGKIIDDISDIKIDTSYFVYTDVVDLSQVEYLSNKFKGMKIVNIDLERKKREPVIIIRGYEDILKEIDKI